MFIRSGECAPETRHSMRGGQGDVELFALMPQEGLPAKCRLLSEIKLVPGASIGFHKHEGETEIFIIKSGAADIMDDDMPLTAYPGDCVATYSGHGHSVACHGGEPLLMTAIIIYD